MDALLSQAFEVGINALEDRRQLVAEMVDMISDGIKALRSPVYGSVYVTDGQAEERARNIATTILLTFSVERQEMP